MASSDRQAASSSSSLYRETELRLALARADTQLGESARGDSTIPYTYSVDQDPSGVILRRASSMPALPRMRVALLITSPNFAGEHFVTWTGQVITTIGRASG